VTISFDPNVRLALLGTSAVLAPVPPVSVLTSAQPRRTS
jgi:hypothetical protein